MAENASIASARGTVAAIDPASVQAAWDRAYFEYERLCLLRDAYSDFGPLARINAEWQYETERLAHKYGSTTCPAAKAEHTRTFRPFKGRFKDEQEEFGRRCDDVTVAMLDLMRTPCPDIKAATAKVDIARWDFSEHGDYNEAVWQAVDADLRRMVQPGT